MSWFYFGDQDRRRYRKGMWLRVRHDANPDVYKLIKKSKLLRFSEHIERIIVKENLRDGKVLLEIWARSLKDMIRLKTRDRFSVFYIDAKENPKWVCEGDMGRGLILKEAK